MKKESIKHLVGIYSGAMCMMAMIVPVSVLSSIAQAFPDTAITTIQLVVTLPSLVAMVSGLLVSKLAHLVYKKHVMIFFTCLYIISGILPVFFHDNIGQLLFSAAMVGLSLGGLQNGMTSMIPDYFEGPARGMVMGLLSTFVCLGGFIYTFLASRLGASNWSNAFYAYLVIIVFLVLEIIFLPKGKLEPKPTKGNPARVPKEVIWLCAMGFILYTCCQLFNSNEALLVTERGLGGTLEAGYASTAYTVSGIVAGLIVGPFMKIFKKHAITMTFIVSAVGLALCAICSNIVILSIGGFLIGIGYQVFTPLSGMRASEYSGATGMAFNLALVNAMCSVGQALSPFTTAALAAPFGSSMFALYMVGVVGCIIIILFAIFHFSRTKKTSLN